MQDFRKWDVCWTKVKYEDSEETKDRPVIVINVSTEYLMVLKCTTHPPRDKFDYWLKLWKSSGLNKPTTIRTRKSIKILKRNVRRKSGRLQFEDILEIKKLL